MNWDNRCCLARVRLMALGAELSAGGSPGRARLRRAIAPLLEDVHQAASQPAGAAAGAPRPGRRRRRAKKEL